MNATMALDQTQSYFPEPEEVKSFRFYFGFERVLQCNVLGFWDNKTLIQLQQFIRN
jgi:hypothetical protein